MRIDDCQEDREDLFCAVEAVIQAGHQVASGAAQDSPYPGGTIALQMPFFRELGLDLRDCFPGTLNLSIAPQQFRIRRSHFTFRQIPWTDRHPPEDFSFLPCRVTVRATDETTSGTTLGNPDGMASRIASKIKAEIAPKAGIYPGWIYYPHPETKRMHFQSASVLEVLTTKIEGIEYGDRVLLEVNPQAIEIFPYRYENCNLER